MSARTVQSHHTRPLSEVGNLLPMGMLRPVQASRSATLPFLPVTMYARSSTATSGCRWPRRRFDILRRVGEIPCSCRPGLYAMRVCHCTFIACAIRPFRSMAPTMLAPALARGRGRDVLWPHERLVRRRRLISARCAKRARGTAPDTKVACPLIRVYPPLNARCPKKSWMPDV